MVENIGFMLTVDLGFKPHTPINQAFLSLWRFVVGQPEKDDGGNIVMVQEVGVEGQ